MTRAALLLMLGACAPAFTEPPAASSVPQAQVAEQRVILDADKSVRVERNPFARQTVRRADYDIAATLLAKDVALVVEPAEGVPIYVSNQLGAALIRRFAGHLPMKEALAAAEVFFVQPVVSGDSATLNGVLVVDWLIRSQRGQELGAVFASRRLSGTLNTSDPWQAFTADDAEFLAIQVAAELAQVGPIRAALENAETLAELDRIPTPVARPRPDTDKPATPAVPNGRVPLPRPVSPGSS